EAAAMNFRHIEVFYAVMTSGTVTEAARLLGVSQPSVTTTLKQAERKLGIALFQREGGRLIPTAEARTLFEEAEHAHEALDSFKNLARRLQVGQGGHVRIAAIPSISLELLPDAIGNFMASHEGFNFSVSTLNTEDILDQLGNRKGAFHLGLTMGQISDQQVTTELVGKTELLAVLPADWKISSRSPLKLSELKQKPYIAGFDGTALARVCRPLFTNAGIEPQVIARIHTHHLAGRLVQRGLGFAILDKVTVRALQHDRLGTNIVARSLEGRPSLPLAAIFPARGALSNPARLFLDSFRATYVAFEKSNS
ncbi:MAG TPA: LysR substrate-binding domain-containing protein, partial [Xanthomonadales bacterium]|nr:LysR substrate-binding domain-containing protein [Xanthomonadales bacterium]